MSCGGPGCPSKIGGPCYTNTLFGIAVPAALYFFSRYMPNLSIKKLSVIGVPVAAVFAYQYQDNLYNYFFPAQEDNSNQPGNLSALTENDFAANTPITTRMICIKGTYESEYFVLPNQPNYVFGGGGLDLFRASPNEDHFFFSMCSTKITNDRVATIDGFDPQNDKIYLFCTKQDVEAKDISIEYSEDKDATFIIIAGKFERTAIALTGNHTDIMDNIHIPGEAQIVLNEKYTDVAGEVCNPEIHEL